MIEYRLILQNIKLFMLSQSGLICSGKIARWEDILGVPARFQAVHVGWAEVFGRAMAAGIFRLANNERWGVYLRIGRIGSMFERNIHELILEIRK